MHKFKAAENQNIQEIESEVLEFWKKNKVFEKSVDQRPAKNLYVFYDGPPFISGLPHYGHLLSSIAKDVIPRYWTMKGKKVERVWGWDAHGLTVENQVQKRLGIKNRRDIEEFGLEEFTEECYRYTSETSAEWNWYVDRIARWVDMDNAYKTIDQDYMESVIWAFKQLYDKGLIYEGIRTSLFCTTCGTPVSNFEIAMDNSYRDFEDPAITVKFKVTTEGSFDGAFILAWTTTPWTIPANRALVIDKDENYVIVKAKNEKYIVGKPRVDVVFEGIEYEIIKEFKGKELEGLTYEPAFDFYKGKESEFKVYHYDGMANMEEGTGIVHSAPGFGEIDTEMGRHFDLTVMLNISDEGNFLPGNNGQNPYEGKFYTDANPDITKDLLDKGLILKNDKISHRVPFHDRCDTNLVQKAQNSWFVNIQKIKEKLIKNNEDINWIPAHLKNGRFKISIETAPDWCISRNRFWATPMPVWESEDGDRIVVGSIKELEDLSGQRVINLHRPYIDEIKIEKKGKTYKRRHEVLDSWMDAGSMPYAQIHYPFENQEKFEKNYPGDYIVEYISQVRAWFYVLHVLSSCLFDTASFKNVVTTGVMAGNDGRKMSKTFKNYTDPKKVLEEIGGDALRLFLMNSPLMVGDNANFDEKELRTKLRNVLNPLWNSAKFFLIYAEEYDFKPDNKVSSSNLLDSWIVGRLHQTLETISENIENYLIPPAVQALEDFVDDLSRWYVRRSRERISSGDIEALSTLYFVLTEFVQGAAPVIPFLSEKIYQLLVSGIMPDSQESVHLVMFPEHDKKIIEKSKVIFKKMNLTREVVSAGLALRTENKIKVRQPLSRIVLPKNLKENIFEDLVMDEVNIKSIDCSEEKQKLPMFEGREYKVYLDINIDENLKLEGMARDFVRKIQELRKKEGLSVADGIKLTYPSNSENDLMFEKYSEYITDKTQTRELIQGNDISIEVIDK